MHDSLEHFEGFELTTISGVAMGPTTWSAARAAASGVPGRPARGGGRFFLRHPLGEEIPVELGGFGVHDGQWITAVWLGRTGLRRRRLLYVRNHSTFEEMSCKGALAAVHPPLFYWAAWALLAAVLLAKLPLAVALLLAGLSALALDRVALPLRREQLAPALIARARRIARGAGGPPEMTRQAFAAPLTA